MPSHNDTDVIVIVDPVSTGLQVTQYIQKLGIRCVAVLSNPNSGCMKHFEEGLSKLSLETTLHYEGDAEGTEVAEEDTHLMSMVSKIKALPYNVMSVLPGCETGVTLAERLASTLGVRCNGMDKIKARRDKFYMANSLADAGLRSVRQVRPKTWEDVEKFVHDLNPKPFKVIMKPCNSAGSDGVVCCRSMEEVRARWDYVSNSKELNVLGRPLEVLVQEFLEGTEYVVDAVSRDGVHKVICVWQYEKIIVNGGDLAYTAMRLVSPPLEGEDDSGLWRSLVDYNNKVLDSLDIMNGASHAEIMVKTLEEETPATEKKSFIPSPSFMAASVAGVAAAATSAIVARSRSNVVALSAAAAAAATGYALSTAVMGATTKKQEVNKKKFDICLVEVGSRCHGAEGTFIPLADRCVGYNQAGITASAYADGVQFDAIPPAPVAPLARSGAVAWLVSGKQGTYRGLNGGEKKLTSLASYIEMRLYVKEGGHIPKTVDVVTIPGSVSLVHESKEQVEADISAIRDMEKNGLFLVDAPTAMVDQVVG